MLDNTKRAAMFAKLHHALVLHIISWIEYVIP